MQWEAEYAQYETSSDSFVKGDARMGMEEAADKLNELEAEKESLHELMDFWKAACKERSDWFQESQAENARLREALEAIRSMDFEGLSVLHAYDAALEIVDEALKGSE